ASIAIGSRRRRAFIIDDVENNGAAIYTAPGVPAFGVGLEALDVFLEKRCGRAGHARNDADLELLRLCECAPRRCDADRRQAQRTTNESDSVPPCYPDHCFLPQRHCSVPIRRAHIPGEYRSA